jgi:hypothetical protein
MLGKIRQSKGNFSWIFCQQLPFEILHRIQKPIFIDLLISSKATTIQNQKQSATCYLIKEIHEGDGVLFVDVTR